MMSKTVGHWRRPLRAPFAATQPAPALSMDALLLRVAQCPADVREWAEKEGYANLADRIASATVASAQAATTLTLLLAGLGGALAIGMRVFEPAPSPLAWGAAALCLYLIGCAAALVGGCLQLREAPAQHNQPDMLLVPGATLEQLRMGELVNLVLRIRQQTEINDRRAARLNGVRWAAITSPLVFVAAAGVAVVAARA